MKRILQEPLLHFLLLGALLFLVYGLVTGPIRGPEEIVVTRGRIEHLAASFTAIWQRKPTETELKGLVDDWVREEIATREAMALGLDQDDTVIRRRLRQKLDFVSDDVAALAEPTDADLNAYLQAHPETFRVEPQLTFSQVYLDPERHGENLAREAARLLAQLRKAGSKADISTLGDPLLLERSFQSAPTSDIAKQFGEGFAAELAKVSPGQWEGPIDSGYGLHLVFVSARTEGRLPDLASVHDAVRREWENAQRLEANRKYYEDLLKRYTVTIESPEPVKPQENPVGRH